jgi:hypothetical protein
MDDLDRLYQHLVASLSAHAPHLLRQRFVIGDLAQQLVPYRMHRRALGFDSIQQYDLALLRLVAGERGYLMTEPVVQDAARQSLSTPRPEAESLRRFADAPAALAPEPLRALIGDAGPTTGPTPGGGAPVASQTAAPTNAPPAPSMGSPSAAPPPPPMGGMRSDPSAGQSPPAAARSPVTTPVEPRAQTPTPAPLAGAPASASVPARDPAPARPPEPPASRPPESQPASPMPFPTRPPNPVMGGPCRYCGQPLPEGRPVTFCPYCGQNVTIVRCPACSTELELGWRFCVTCGRTMDGAPANSPAGAPAG